MRNPTPLNEPELWRRFETSLLNDSITRLRINKLRTMYVAAERGLGKLSKAGKPEIERFVAQISRDEFRREDGKPYGGLTKRDIKKFLKQFYKWYQGEGEYYPKSVSWIKARVGKDEKPAIKEALTRKEVTRLAARMNRPDYRLLTLLLFDSGFRISEMLSAKKSDLTREKIKGVGQVWYLACRESKTYERRVDVSLFTEDINGWVNSVDYRRLKQGDALFPVSYRHYYNQLRYHSEQALKKKVTPHALRHSSATLYAGIYNGDRIKLAERYGWSYSAKELDTYVRRSNGVRQEESVKIIAANEVTQLRDELDAVKEQLAALTQVVAASTSKEDVQAAIKRKAAKVRYNS